jgi:phosphoribosyl 1,2-cyclic phosphate phosphodiesterase
MDMPIYGPEETMFILQRNYDYMFTKETFQGGGVAHLLPNVVVERFELCGFELLPIPVQHGAVETVGFRIDNFGYVPDVKVLPDESKDLLRGVAVLILDALSFNPRHPTHLSVGEAVAIIAELQPREAYLTHVMHRLDHRHFREQCEEQKVELPPNVYLAFDGQVIELR